MSGRRSLYPGSVRRNVHCKQAGPNRAESLSCSPRIRIDHNDVIRLQCIGFQILGNGIGNPPRLGCHIRKPLALYEVIHLRMFLQE